MRAFASVCGASLALMTLTSGAALAQNGAVKAIFEKHKLLGTFAFDCTKPASKQNIFFVHRLVDPDHVQRDAMEGPNPADRAFLVVIDKAAEAGPNRIAVSGTRDGKPFSSVYQIEGNRQRVMESTVDGKLVITGGRTVGGGELPWTNTCTKAPG